MCVCVSPQDAIVRAANSYTSYKEMWADELHLDQTEQGSPMVVMEAAMVRLPFAVSRGHDSLLRTIVEADVAVEIFGSETLKAIIAYKWQEFAKRQVRVILSHSEEHACTHTWIRGTYRV